jgi:hypothetical protein
VRLSRMQLRAYGPVMMGMTRWFVGAVAAAGVLLSEQSSAQQANYDVKTINFDLWCQEQAQLPVERCDKRLPEDEKTYEAFRDTIEKYELPHLKDKEREHNFDTDILHNDPVDNPPTQTSKPDLSTKTNP